jgi:fructosamine-3-kinase
VTFIENLKGYFTAGNMGGGGGIELKLLAGAGTLGVCFWVKWNGNIFFLKTHYTGERFLKTMEQQIDILDMLYGKELSVNKFYLNVEGNKYCFLLMDWLESPAAAPRLWQIERLIAFFNAKFESEKLRKKRMHSFNEILKEGSKALAALYKAGLINNNNYKRCLTCHQVLALESASKKPCICHGDLSNKNIMAKNDVLYLLDWEDAFIGIEGYDLCYWLTFFDQRKLYSKYLFSDIGIDKYIGISLMATIVIIKSYISYLNNNYRNNLLSFDNRLEEIFLMSQGAL